MDDLPKLFLCNPQSLTNYFEEFTNCINKTRPHVVSVCDTWFSINNPASEFELKEYNQYSKSRTDRRGGGVAMYVHESMEVRELNISVPDELECVWIGVKRNISRNIKLIAFCILYHPPEANTHDALMIT